MHFHSTQVTKLLNEWMFLQNERIISSRGWQLVRISGPSHVRGLILRLHVDHMVWFLTSRSALSDSDSCLCLTQEFPISGFKILIKSVINLEWHIDTQCFY